MLAAARVLAWSTRRDLRWLGLFVIGPVLLDPGPGRRGLYTQAAELVPALKSYWLVIHVSVAILAVAVFTIGFSAVTVVYLRQATPSRRAGRATAARTASRPRRRWSGSRTGCTSSAFPLWTFTLVAGAIWAPKAWGSYWSWDPKEVWTFVIWVVYAAYLHARATSGMGAARRRRGSRSPGTRACWSTSPWSTCSSSASTPTRGCEARAALPVLRLLVFFGCLLFLWLVGLREQGASRSRCSSLSALHLAGDLVLRAARFREESTQKLARPRSSAARGQGRGAAGQTSGPRTPSWRRTTSGRGFR